MSLQNKGRRRNAANDAAEPSCTRSASLAHSLQSTSPSFELPSKFFFQRSSLSTFAAPPDISAVAKEKKSANWAVDGGAGAIPPADRASASSAALVDDGDIPVSACATVDLVLLLSHLKCSERFATSA
jgi:hypothetical protein